jgi:hypothetical protein
VDGGEDPRRRRMDPDRVDLVEMVRGHDGIETRVGLVDAQQGRGQSEADEGARDSDGENEGSGPAAPHADETQRPRHADEADEGGQAAGVDEKDRRKLEHGPDPEDDTP